MEVGAPESLEATSSDNGASRAPEPGTANEPGTELVALGPPEEPTLPPGPSQVKGYSIRAVAFILDLIVLNIGRGAALVFQFFLMMALMFAAASGGPSIEPRRPGTVPSLVAGLVVSLAYFSLFEWLFGATPGKAVLGLRVVGQDGSACTLKAALIRAFYRLIDGPFIVVWAVVSTGLLAPERFGDRRAKTVVVGRTDPFIRQRRSAWRFILALVLLSFFAGVVVLGAGARLLRGGDAHVWRGYAAFSTGSYDLAAEQFELGLMTGVTRYNLEEVYTSLANSYRALGRYDDALDAGERALKINPDYYLAWHVLGEIYLELGDLDTAEIDYRRALELQPDFGGAAVGLGIVLLERGNVEGAVRAFESARISVPFSASAKRYSWLAFAYAKAGRFDAAEEALRQAKRYGYTGWAELEQDIKDLKAGQGGDGERQP